MKISVKWKLWITITSVLKRLLSFRNNTGPQNTLPRMTPLPVFLNTIVVQCSWYTLLFMSIVLVTIMMTTLYGHYLLRVVHSYQFLCSSLSILAFPEAHPLVPGDASYWQTLPVFIKFWQIFGYFPPNIAYLPFFLLSLSGIVISHMISSIPPLNLFILSYLYFFFSLGTNLGSNFIRFILPYINLPNCV